VAGTVLLVLLVAGGLWTWRLAERVEERWAAHAPAVPSRVYASTTALYPGRALPPDRLIRELEARDYRPVEALPPAAVDGARVASGRLGETPPADPDETPPADPDTPGGAVAGLAPGAYRATAGAVEVHLRDFVYPLPRGRVPGRALRVTFRDGRIAALRDLRDGRRVMDAELEPRQVATLLDDRMVRREPVTLGEIPAVLLEAVMAVEDRRFWEHPGVDPVRVAGAALHDLRTGRLAQGGSTITQQLVKNYWLGPEKTFVRKIREAVMALLLEARRDKPEILLAYLNEVYLGQDGPVGIAGVGAASRHYFGRETSRLGLAESALLAGMIRAPNRYDPLRRPGAARQRRDLVLELMERQGRITAEQSERARREPLPDPRPSRPVGGAQWYVDRVQRELDERYSREDLRREGLRIFTAMEPRAQAAADRAVREGLEALEEGHPDLVTEGEERLQAALVALDPRTGDLLALVGGRDWSTTQFDRATRARRQPGSLFKPFVYLTALADTSGRWTLASVVPDTSFTVRAGGETWSPANYDGEEHGEVTLRTALEQSYNVATARLATDLGLESVVETARRLGLGGRLRPVPAAALGAFEVTPVEMAAAYAALAGGGIRPEPLSVLQVTGPAGEALEARELSMRRVAPAGPVHLVNRALQGVLERGTAAGIRELGYAGPAAGKTGTTDGYRDAWFVGYTPEVVVLVWVGFDDNRTVGRPGAEAAVPIWARFVEAHGQGAFAGFTAPAGVDEARVETPDGECRAEWFLEGTVPEEKRCGGLDLWPF
jgi:penicillin-binding protein 1B